MMHKIVGGLLKRHKIIKTNENEQAINCQEVLSPEIANEELHAYESVSVLSTSRNFHPGIIVTTGAVDNREEHKRAAPRQSPSNYKK